MSESGFSSRWPLDLSAALALPGPTLPAHWIVPTLPLIHSASHPLCCIGWFAGSSSLANLGKYLRAKCSEDTSFLEKEQYIFSVLSFLQLADRITAIAGEIPHKTICQLLLPDCRIASPQWLTTANISVPSFMSRLQGSWAGSASAFCAFALGPRATQSMLFLRQSAGTWKGNSNRRQT